MSPERAHHLQVPNVAIAGAAMSGMTKDEIVEATGYRADLVVAIWRDAGISTDGQSSDAVKR